MRDEHDEYMDGLARRVAMAVDGVKCTDVAMVCAVAAAFSVSEADANLEERRELFEKTVKFMRDQFDGMIEQKLQ